MANFPTKFFPVHLEGLIKEASDVYQFHTDYLCASVLSVCATSFGNTYSLRVKGNWIERPSLFMAIVGSPGVNKSAPLSWAIGPIEAQEKLDYKEYKRYIQEFREDEKNAGKNPKPLSKTIISDATPEAVVQQLHINERGIMIYNDELSGFLNTFQRYNKGNDEQFYLSVWSGKPVVVDRKTAVSIRINEPVINVIGSIPPNILDKSFAGKEDSGFFDRWLLTYPLGVEKKPWSDTEARPEVAAEYQKIVNSLLKLQFKLSPEGEPYSIILEYERDAYSVLKKWQIENTRLINETDQDGIKAIRSKMETYCHRFALIQHMMEYACGGGNYVPHRVNKKSVELALALSDYYIQSATSIRTGTAADRLTGQWIEVYDMLPGNGMEFTTLQFLDLTDKFEISERTAKRWLTDQIGKTITKVKHGTYSRTH